MTWMGTNSLSQSLPGADDIYRRELANGIVVLARSNFNSPSVVANGYLLAGREQPDLADIPSWSLTRPVEQPSPEERRRPVRVQSVRQLAFAM